MSDKLSEFATRAIRAVLPFDVLRAEHIMELELVLYL